MRPAMANGRCNLHGGGALAGVAHQNFRSGRYAQDLPVRLRERYGRSLVDPNQLSLADDLAVKDARIGDLLSKLPSDGEMERGWQAFQSQFAAAKLARLRANDESQTEEQRAAAQAHFWQSWAEIERLYGEVQQMQHAAEALWAAIAFEQGEKRKLVDTEIARVAKAAEHITRDQAALLIGGIAAVIRAHVSDRPTLQRIQDGIRRLVQFDAGG